MNCMKFLKIIYFVRNLYQCGKTVSLRSVTKTVTVGYCLEFRKKKNFIHFHSMRLLIVLSIRPNIPQKKSYNFRQNENSLLDKNKNVPCKALLNQIHAVWEGLQTVVSSFNVWCLTQVSCRNLPPTLNWLINIH